MKPGARNLITDIAGLTVGQAEDVQVRTGVTVLCCRQAFPAAVDVRGGGPGSRETDALSAENLVGGVHAIVLTGGSVFGLAAADGVTAALSAEGVGLHLVEGTPAIPIVPAAVLHDLANGGDKDWGRAPPYRQLGMEALAHASADFALGRVGAGLGARAGQLPGGIGSVSLDLGGGLMVGSLMAANPSGSVVMDDGETYWAAPFEIDGEFGGRGVGPVSPHSDPLPATSRLARAVPGTNTTIGIVATSADLTRAEVKRLAMMAQDGIARAVRPAHTPFDGDMIFALGTGAVSLGSDPRARSHALARLGSAAADCVARAIARGVHAARSMPA